MLDKKTAKRIFQEVRLIIYAVLAGNGLLIQFIVPVRYLCDYEDYNCPMCGMRAAVSCLFRLDFKSAYQSNKYILFFIIVAFVIIIDCIFLIKRKC